MNYVIYVNTYLYLLSVKETPIKKLKDLLKTAFHSLTGHTILFIECLIWIWPLHYSGILLHSFEYTSRSGVNKSNYLLIQFIHQICVQYQKNSLWMPTQGWNYFYLILCKSSSTLMMKLIQEILNLHKFPLLIIKIAKCPYC